MFNIHSWQNGSIKLVSRVTLLTKGFVMRAVVVWFGVVSLVFVLRCICQLVRDLPKDRGVDKLPQYVVVVVRICVFVLASRGNDM